MQCTLVIHLYVFEVLRHKLKERNRETSNLTFNEYCWHNVVLAGLSDQLKVHAWYILKIWQCLWFVSGWGLDPVTLGYGSEQWFFQKEDVQSFKYTMYTCNAVMNAQILYRKKYKALKRSKLLGYRSAKGRKRLYQIVYIRILDNTWDIN